MNNLIKHLSSRFITLGISALLMATLNGCGSDERSTSNAIVTNSDKLTLPEPELCEQYIEFPFDLDSSTPVVPYPNNLFTVEDSSSSTGFRLSVNRHFALFKEHYNFLSFWLKPFETLEGFGLYSDLFIPLPSADISLASDRFTEIEQGVFAIVIDPEHPLFGEVAPVYASLEKHYLRLTPIVPLLENTDYALVVTNDWQQEEPCYKASLSMDNLINQMINTPSAINHESLLLNLEQLGISRNSLLSISQFTTMPIFADMNHVQEILDDLNEEAPAQLTEWTVEASEKPLTQAYIHAKLETPLFSNHKGVWRNGSDRTLKTERTENVDITLSLPNQKAIAYEQPYPIMIYMHGTNKSRLDVKDVSDWFAEAGMATIGMDALCHGDRFNIVGNDPLCYYNFISPLTWRDNGRETVAGTLWLIHAIKQLAEVDMIPEGGDGIPDFDVNQIYVTGVSLGGIQAGMLAGLAPEIEGLVFNVAGAKFTDIAFDHAIVKNILALTNNLDSITGSNLTHLAYLAGMVFQSLLDASDPGVYLYNARRLHDFTYNALQQGAAFDNQVSGSSGATFARAGGWPQLQPYVFEAGVPLVDAPHTGSGFVQYDTADHDMIWRDDNLAFDLQNQIQHFLITLRDNEENKQGEIIVYHD